MLRKCTQEELDAYAVRQRFQRVKWRSCYYTNVPGNGLYTNPDTLEMFKGENGRTLRAEWLDAPPNYVTDIVLAPHTNQMVSFANKHKIEYLRIDAQTIGRLTVSTLLSSPLISNSLVVESGINVHIMSSIPAHRGFEFSSNIPLRISASFIQTDGASYPA